ncbi:MAG: c-type cytochrome [Rhodothermales bacterium]|nr:c-type cytochrome [Rhodothermales bacterium]MBO6780426.1 c-type cytochrome [Rhodothermales bacterium]
MKRVLPLVLGVVVAACTTPPQQRGTTGAEVYATTCAACHAADGLGVNEAFPPLKDSPWVSLPDSLLIRLTLRGLRGPIQVNGREYNNMMPPHAFLTDEQLAAVLTFVRTEFGAGGLIEPDQVAAERQRFGSGPMWTIQELTAAPE